MKQNTNRKKLTKSLIDGLLASEKDYFVWDTELRNFGLKVTSKGRKTYVAHFRIAGVGNSKRMTIGVHGETFVQQARKKAADILNEARKGNDPTAELKALKQAVIVSEALERFYSEHVRCKLKPSSIENYEILKRVHLEPAFGEMRLKDVTRNRIEKFHSKFAHQPASGNKQLAVLSKFFNWCEANELIDQGSNPCKHIPKFKEQSRERYLNDRELIRLNNVLEHAEEDGLACSVAINSIKMLMLTGARRGEILSLKWSYIDFENQVLNLPDSKTGKKTIVLSSAAFELLKTIKKTDNPFVFQGKKETAHFVNLKKPWKNIREASGLADVRIHDLRHTFASHAINNGAPLELISKLLGHSQLRTTQRYAHLQNDRLRETADLVAVSVKKNYG